MLAHFKTLTRRTLLVTGFAVASLGLAPLPSHAATAISIAAARHLPLGTVVTVQGSVTVPSGTFASSFFDEGFAVQDRTAGIYVSMPDNLGLKLRQEAEVTGTLTDSGGLLVIVPAADSDVSVVGRGQNVVPRFSFTGGIGEATEGQIVLVVGRITSLEDDAPFGQKVFINDGSGQIRIVLNVGTGATAGLHVGQVIFVTGFSGQFEDYEIDTRFPSDITRF
jgi:hypothetical protein